MTARLILPPGADEEDWKAERLKGVTASEIAVVLGISPFDSAYNLYWKKLGAIPDDFDNDRLELGRVLEPYVASRFRKAHPQFHLAAPAGLWASAERPWQLCTPDGRVFEDVCRCGATGDVLCSCLVGVDEPPVAVWEGKTSATYEGWGEDGTDEIPAYYAAQVLWQMDVIGVPVGYVSCFFLSTQEIRTYRLAYDVADVDLMRTRATEFLARLAAGNPPPLDAHASTTAALKALHPDVDADETVTVPKTVARDYQAAKRAAARATERVRRAENKVRRYLGDAKYAVDPDGQKLATRSVYDRKGYTVGPAHIDALKPAPTKKETAA